MRHLPVLSALTASILWGSIYAIAPEMLPHARPVFLGAALVLPAGLAQMAFIW